MVLAGDLLAAVDIGGIVERFIRFLYWLATPLVLKMPMETCKWPVLSTFVLKKQRTLVDSKNIIDNILYGSS